MMDGLIVKEPFATQLVKGKKLIEFRTRPLPKNKTNVKVYILCKGFVKGYVIFDSDRLGSDNIHQWNVIESKEFSPYMKYKHKNGCIIWINDVEVFE